MIGWLRKQRRRGYDWTPTLTGLLDDVVRVALEADVISELKIDSQTGVYHYHFKLMPCGFDTELARISEEETT